LAELLRPLLLFDAELEVPFLAVLDFLAPVPLDFVGMLALLPARLNC
jgi:hypothetical protein